MPTTRITVVSTSVLKSGDTWTLREVVAADAQGVPIERTLKTFEANLPIGQLIEVEVEKNADPRYDEYLVRLPGSKKGGGGGGGGQGGLGRGLDLLRDQVESLTTRVAALEGRMDAATPAPRGGVAGTGFAQHAGQPLGGSLGAPPVTVPDDDDIPF